MKQLFLTSEVSGVAKDISTKIKTKSGNLKTAYIITPVEKGFEEGEDMSWHEENKKSMTDSGFEIFEYTITGKDYEKIKSDLENYDVIYVEGGSLVHMLNKSRETGFDVFIKGYIENGGVYIGTSTGSFIMAEDTAPGLPLETYLETEGFDAKGIGLVNFLVMPHWGSDYFKESYRKVPDFAYDMKIPLIVLTDTQYVHVLGDSFKIVDVSV